jgi:hypothetical protein
MLAAPVLTLITSTPAVGEYFVSGRVGVVSQLQAPFSGVGGGQTRISGFSGATAGNSALSDTENLIRAAAEL